MIDYHCHLLPGFDDGPTTVDEALTMARALAAYGFREACCTPHCIKGHYEYTPAEVREAVAKLQGMLDAAGIALKLNPGMEYYLDGCFEQFAANLLPLGESRLVLCEAPPQVYPEMVVELAGLIVDRGYIPLLAHPERSDVVWQLLGNDREQAPGRVVEAEKDGPSGSLWGKLASRHKREVRRPEIPGSRDLPEETRFQGNLGSFIGFYGPQPQQRGYQLLRRGIYACLASDLHEGRTAAEFLQAAKDKVEANPALQKLREVSWFRV